MHKNTFPNLDQMTDFKKVFLDTTPIIYFLDDNPNYSDKVETILSLFIKQKIQIITSVITCSEYLILPYRTNNIEKEIAFFEFLNDCKIPICQIDLNTAKLASTIRAKYNYFKAMDCLQIASAMSHNCDLFLTNDKQLKQFNAITCLTIDDLIKEL